MKPIVKKALFITSLAIALMIAIIVGGIIVSKLTCSHNNEYEIEILPFKAATCQEEGLTAGKKCNYCGKILEAQESIPTIACNESKWIIDQEATNTADGYKHTECTLCGRTIQQVTLYAFHIDTQGLVYSKNDDGTYSVRGSSSCSNTDIVIPSTYSGSPVTKIANNAFHGHTTMKSISIPSTVKTIGSSAFSYCSSLQSIIIPQSVTSIGDNSFYNCDSLRSVAFQNRNITIGASAFDDCDNLQDVTLPLDLKVIQPLTFQNCHSLTTITIPNRVTSIHYQSFLNCTSLKTIIFSGTTSEWRSIKFGPSWRDGVPATEVICSNGTISLD